VPAPHDPHDLPEEDRARLSRAHHRLRNASQAIEGLVAAPSQRGRWVPRPPTAEALAAAEGELRAAYEAVQRLHEELLG
jgi:two-component sensor histidine kinase